MKPLLLLLLTAISILPTNQYWWGWWDGVSCHNSCYYCYIGSNPWYCAYCDGNHVAYYWDFTYCYCPDGYVEVGQPDCAPCNYPCSTCSSNQNNCNQCSSWSRGPTPSCNCIAGYYDTGSPLCSACSYKCATCVSSANNCLSCPSTRSGTPSCNCVGGYY